MSEDEIIIQKYREAFSRYAKDGIIDLDNQLMYKFNFHAYRLENFIPSVGGIVPPIRHSNSYLICLVKRGTGVETIGQYTFPIQDDMLLIMTKSVVHSTKYWSLDCAGYWITFNADFFLQTAFPRQYLVNKKIFKRSIKPFVLLTESQVAQIETIYLFILKEYHEYERCKDEMIAIKILELLIQCDRLIINAEAEPNVDSYSDLVDRFNELIEQNFQEKRSVRFYADALHVHPNHLNFVVKKITGITAKETIMNHILLEARFLLRSSTLSIKEIAYKLGFDDPNYFSSFFKNGVELSPAQYRQESI
jgi:AraC-like DNA-binding protein